MPSGDKFLGKFLTLYKSDDSGEFKNSLIMSLLASFVSKASGCCNPEYGSKVVNFMLAYPPQMLRHSVFFFKPVSMSIRHAGRLKLNEGVLPWFYRLMMISRSHCFHTLE